MLAGIIELYVSRLPAGHDRVKMKEAIRHLSETHFSWIGCSGPEILLLQNPQPGDLDRIRPPLRRRAGQRSSGEIPRSYFGANSNGNDYGKDLLRQHYEHFHRKANERALFDILGDGYLHRRAGRAMHCDNELTWRNHRHD